MRADDVRAEDLAVLLVPQDLDEALRLAGAARPAVGGEGKLAGDVIELLLFTLILRQPDARHLGMTVGHARHVVVLDGMRLLACDELGYHDAFAAAFVRQHRGARDVSDGVITRGARLQVLVHFDEAALRQLDAAFLEADVLDVYRPTRGHEHRGRGDLLLLAAGLHIERDLVLADVRLGDLRSGDHLDPPLAVALVQGIRRLGVLEREDPRQCFDDGHFDAERVEDVGEFHPHRSRADNRERGRHALHQQRFIGGDDRRLVDFEPDLGDTFDT